MLQGEFTNSSQYLEVLDSFPNVKAAELVAVELVKDYKNCALAEEVANRMIKIDPRNVISTKSTLASNIRKGGNKKDIHFASLSTTKTPIYISPI